MYSDNECFSYQIAGRVLNLPCFTLKPVPPGIFLIIPIHPGAVISFSRPAHSLKKQSNKVDQKTLYP